MRRGMIAIITAGMLASAGAVAEGLHYRAHASVDIGVIDPSTMQLGPAPIPAEWIIDGHPVTEGRRIAQTADASQDIYIWQTTAGRFKWIYNTDEVVVIQDGEVFVTDASKAERRLGPGDVGFFPAGSTAVWRVPDHVRKIASLKKILPEPFASLVRWSRLAKAVIQPGSGNSTLDSAPQPKPENDGAAVARNAPANTPATVRATEEAAL